MHSKISRKHYEMKNIFRIALITTVLASPVVTESSPLCSHGRTSDPTIPVCSVSADELVHGRTEKGSIQRDYHFPPWLNVTLFRRAQQFFKTNLLTVGFGSIYGFIGISAVPDNRDMLVFTNTSDSLDKALKRAAATVCHITLWYNSPISNEYQDENGVTSSFSTIRYAHLHAVHKARSRGPRYYNPKYYEHLVTDDQLWKAFKDDLDSSKIPMSLRSFSKEYHQYDNIALPINQFSQGIALFSPSGFLFVRPSALHAMDVKDEDLRAMLHMCAVMGYGLGTDDRYNICLQPDLPSAKAYFKKVFEKYFLPGIFNLNKGYKVMLDTILRGYSERIPGLRLRFILIPFLRDLIGIPARHTTSVLTLMERMSLVGFDNVINSNGHLPDFQKNFGAFFQAVANISVSAVFGKSESEIELAQQCYFDGSENKINKS